MGFPLASSRPAPTLQRLCRRWENSTRRLSAARWSTRASAHWRQVARWKTKGRESARPLTSLPSDTVKRSIAFPSPLCTSQHWQMWHNGDYDSLKRFSFYFRFSFGKCMGPSVRDDGGQWVIVHSERFIMDLKKAHSVTPSCWYTWRNSGKTTWRITNVTQKNKKKNIWE